MKEKVWSVAEERVCKDPEMQQKVYNLQIYSSHTFPDLLSSVPRKISVDAGHPGAATSCGGGLGVRTC